MDDAAFVGIGELPSGRYPDRNFMGDLVAAAHLALADARLTPRDVDTVVLIPCLHSFIDQADLVFSRVVEELGLSKQVKSQFMVHSGGSTSDNAVRAAGSLLCAGEADTVLILQAERWGSAPVEAMIDTLSFNGIPLEWEIPAGQNFNAIGALITARYMYETGSTPEEMAGICVALRRWANLNPNAMYRDKPLTVEQILASKMVCEPLHAMECPMMADGAVGLVMTTPDRAARRGQDAVRIAGTGGCVSHYSLGQETDLARLGWPKAAEAAYDASGWGPEDVQLAEVYDSYAAVMAIAFEGLGLAKPGEGARFIAGGETSPGGSLPANTNGGLLSGGHTGVGGGTALLAEGVRQLLGRAGPPRQVPDVRRALIGGTGGSYMDAQVMMLERVDARGTGGVPATKAVAATGGTR
ncbi:MAG TPA: thiolase family protein [Acidimicrobiia bacterium]|nr:thiolase family protein [Acidimicrobiia bacterium]